MFFRGSPFREHFVLTMDSGYSHSHSFSTDIHTIENLPMPRNGSFYTMAELMTFQRNQIANQNAQFQFLQQQFHQRFQQNTPTFYPTFYRPQ
ncbi:unnamed protein product [Bursaphelenchus xylophilus]|nr:unnamed protein product [Bursaphelenchus xylophilus]CAG9132343.1 unnamed protein product [Bursaphelenchus xylophilus]